MERLHKISAGLVFAFLCLHFANHFLGLEGIDAHIQFMDAARLVYRHPIVELIILLAFVVQILSGVALSKIIWRDKKDFVHQLQAASGTILIIFIVLHLISISVARGLFNLDTNFYFATASLTAPGWKYIYFPLYGAGIIALFVHMGCILYALFKKTNKPVGYSCLAGMSALGLYVTYLLLMMYSGQFYRVNLPDTYAAAFGMAIEDPVPNDRKADSLKDKGEQK